MAALDEANAVLGELSEQICYVKTRERTTRGTDEEQDADEGDQDAADGEQDAEMRMRRTT